MVQAARCCSRSKTPLSKLPKPRPDPSERRPRLDGLRYSFPELGPAGLDLYPTGAQLMLGDLQLASRRRVSANLEGRS